MLHAMERKLASIQTIVALNPINKADRIERATVMGWNVVVKKGEFSVGDKCVFFEIDSVLPSDVEWSQFLKDHSFRVSTMKLRGVISQGLALPLSILFADASIYDVGQDVTDIAGVTQWLPPEDSVVDGAKAYPFPAGIPKSHATRVQSCPGVLDELRHVDFIVTMKCDGKSATFLKRDGELVVASHLRSMERPDKDRTGNIFWQMAEKYEFEKKLPEGMSVQGEICGPGIEGNPMRLSNPEFFVYDVFDIGTAKYLDFDDMISFCRPPGHGMTVQGDWLSIVPIVMQIQFHGTGYSMYVNSGGILNSVMTVPVGEFDLTLERCLAMADGMYPGTDSPREGIVIKPMQEKVSEALGFARLQIKVHSVDYLLGANKKG